MMEAKMGKDALLMAAEHQKAMYKLAGEGTVISKCYFSTYRTIICAVVTLRQPQVHQLVSKLL